MDRFHPLPFDSRAIDPLAQGRPVGSRATDALAQGRPFDDTSWAEWLYFNGRSSDGSLRFYLTFLAAGPRDRSGTRPMFVRLQLNRGGTTTNYSAAGNVDGRALLAHAPDLDVAGNRVRLDDEGNYRITLSLAREPLGPSTISDPQSGIRNPQSPIRNPQSAILNPQSAILNPQSAILNPQSAIRNPQSRIPHPQSRLEGELTLTPAASRSIPPAEIHGARGWVSGYVVPVLSGTFSGRMRIGGEDVQVDGAAGYHDHNWGFWEGVQWQWGQVAGGGVSIVYGRVFPPADVADRNRIPGFLGVIGTDGPIAFSTDVSIREEDQGGTPRAITVESRDRRVRLTLRLSVSEAVRTAMGLTRGPGGTMTFLQLGGEYRVSGRAGEVDVNFTARGSAETFRPNP
jgi:major type 1 subunit fimbrin (pilin)